MFKNLKQTSVASSSTQPNAPSSSRSGGNSSPPPLDPSELDIDDIPQGFKVINSLNYPK